MSQQQAKELLEVKSVGVSLSFLLKKHSLQLVARLLLIAFGISMFWNSGSSIALLMSGVLIGAMVQDLGWYWKMSYLWPFATKITDWNKVEDIANTKESS